VSLDVTGFALLAGILTIMPGQDTVLVLRNATTAGAAAGLATTAGVCSGLFFHATLSALGVSALLVASASAFAALRWVGAAYVVWLGLESLLRLRRSRRVELETGRPTAGARRSFLQGLLSNLLNPKTAVFYLALLPQFAVFRESVLRDSLLLAALHFAMAFVWLGVIALLADRARAWLARPAVTRGVDALAGVALLAFGLRLALARR
jgi:threonine/homoserine/homoserine lactone efflux protein